MRPCRKCDEDVERCDCSLGLAPQRLISRPRTFDVAKFFAALDTIRRYRRMSWRDVAAETDVAASTLTRIAQGKRPDVDNLCRLIDWAGLSLSSFYATSGVPTVQETK